MRDLQALEALARPQAGIVGRGQLLAAGWSGSRIDRATRSGRIIRIVPGTYRVTGAPWTRQAAQHTAALLVAPDGALARWTAAELHGFCEPRRGPVHVVLPHGRRPPEAPPDLLRIQRSRRLEPGSLVTLGGLPLTTGALTVLHLAATSSTGRLTEIVAAALRVGACTADQLLELIASNPGATGRGRLRAAVALLGDDAAASRSDVEVAALTAIVDAGLPRPVLAHRAHDAAGRSLGELDLAYPGARVAIEIDGYRWHSSPARKQADEERQNGLVVAGWTVLRFIAADVRDRPDRIVHTVRAALSAAGAVA